MSSRWWTRIRRSCQATGSGRRRSANGARSPGPGSSGREMRRNDWLKRLPEWPRGLAALAGDPRTWLVVWIAGFAMRIIGAITRMDMVWADQHYQTLEPAGHVVFGYGYMTWEWSE